MAVLGYDPEADDEEDDHSSAKNDDPADQTLVHIDRSTIERLMEEGNMFAANGKIVHLKVYSSSFGTNSF